MGTRSGPRHMRLFEEIFPQPEGTLFRHRAQGLGDEPKKQPPVWTNVGETTKMPGFRNMILSCNDFYKNRRCGYATIWKNPQRIRISDAVDCENNPQGMSKTLSHHSHNKSHSSVLTCLTIKKWRSILNDNMTNYIYIYVQYMIGVFSVFPFIYIYIYVIYIYIP